MRAHRTRFRPDIVFLDIVMPKIDGGDVAQQIRSDPLLENVPIVFLTAIVSQRETRSEIGGFPFLAKPVSLDAITKCLAEHLDRKSLTLDGDISTVAPPAFSPALAGMGRRIFGWRLM